MIRKILLIFKILLKAKYIFSNPKIKKILIFDGNTSKELRHVLSGYNYSILETRINRVREIYLSKEIFYSFINNLQKYLTCTFCQLLNKLIQEYLHIH